MVCKFEKSISTGAAEQGGQRGNRPPKVVVEVLCPPKNVDQVNAHAQNERRCGFLKQLRAMQYLLRQGLALRGHVEKEGNLTQLLMSL